MIEEERHEIRGGSGRGSEGRLGRIGSNDMATFALGNATLDSAFLTLNAHGRDHLTMFISESMRV